MLLNNDSDFFGCNRTLFPGTVGRNPEPSISKIVVDEEDVALLERQLVRVRHLRVRQDCNHPLPIVDLNCEFGFVI
jgi:hypothetical protein